MRPDVINWQDKPIPSCQSSTFSYSLFSRVMVSTLMLLALQAICSAALLYSRLPKSQTGDLLIRQSSDRASVVEPSTSGSIVGLDSWLIQAGIVALLIALISPILVAIALRPWTLGLRSLKHGVKYLAEQMEPRPIPLCGTRELLSLGAAFNDMAGRLHARRVELQANNLELEKRVTQRTNSLHAAMQDLDTLARVDALTGLFNRRALMDALSAMTKDCSRHMQPLACLAIDLDGFKGVNDTLGHAEGDKLLQFAAECLKQERRETDVVSRPGGDEFVVLLPACDEDSALCQAETLLRIFTDSCSQNYGDMGLSITPSMSIGVVCAHPSHAVSSNDLMRLADEALYDAKGAGKRCIRLRSVVLHKSSLPRPIVSHNL